MVEPIVIKELFLTPEDQQTLEAMAPAFEMLRKNLDKLKRAGLDVTEAETDYESGRKLWEGALRELTRK